MNTKSKIFFFLIIFLWIGTTGIAYLFFTQKEKIRNEYIQVKQNFAAEKNRLDKRLSLAGNEIKALSTEKEKLQTERKDLQAEIKKIFQDIKRKEKECKTLERKYESVFAKQNSLAGQLKKIIGEKIVLKKEIKDLHSEPFLAKILEEKTRMALAREDWREEKGKLVQALTKKLLAQEKKKFSLEERLNELKQSLEIAQRDKQKLKKQITNIVKLFKQNLEKISKVRSAKQLSDEITRIKDSLAFELKGVELPTVVVRAEKPIQIQEISTVKGEIVQVNKQHNFVIIDLGINKGFKKGALLGVYRDRQKIGGIRIIELREGVSAADIVDSKKEIRVGDEVSRGSSVGRARD